MSPSTPNFIYSLDLSLKLIGDPQYLTDHHTRDGEALAYISIEDAYSDFNEKLIDALTEVLPTEVAIENIRCEVNRTEILTESNLLRISALLGDSDDSDDNYDDDSDDYDDNYIVVLTKYEKTKFAFTEHKIPEGDLPALINGDYSSMTEQNIDDLNRYVANNTPGKGYWAVTGEQPEVTASPSYGLPGNTSTVWWIYEPDTVALEPASSEIWLGYGMIITEISAKNEYIEFDCDGEMLEKFAPYESYGSDSNQAGYDFYHVAGNIPITFNRLVAMRDDMVKHHTYVSNKALNVVEIEDGCLYDSEDGSYTAWEDLDDDYQSEIREFYRLQGENGESFKEYDNGDSHYFYSPISFAAFWVDSLNSAINELKPYMI